MSNQSNPPRQPNPGDPGEPLTPEQFERLRRRLLAIPLHEFLGLEIVRAEPGVGEARLQVTVAAANIAGVVHGGIFYALLDVACYLGTVPLLGAGENAVTHDIHCSVLRPVKVGQLLELKGHVRHRGRTLVFGDAEAWADGKLVATGRVTKSIVNQEIGIRES